MQPSTVQVKKEHASDMLVLSDPVSSICKYVFLSIQSLQWIIFSILKSSNLKEKERAEEKEKNVGRQKINHIRIILGLSCATRDRSPTRRHIRLYQKRSDKSSKNKFLSIYLIADIASTEKQNGTKENTAS